MKLVTAAVTAVLAIAAAGPAFAVTVKNNSNVEITIGVDLGSSEKVETIGAGKSESTARTAAASPARGAFRGWHRATTSSPPTAPPW